jgi:Fe-S-cluster containining protein
MYRLVSQNTHHCKRCGTCCTKGGPTLHREDRKILLAGYAGYQHLITIRKGELAFNPVHGKLQPVRREIIKVIGKEDSWTCYFFDEKENACTIYENRFLECRILKCWDTSELESIIGKNTLRRTDVINPDDPIITVIETHDKECSCQEVEELISKVSSGKQKKQHLERLASIVQKDIGIRSFAFDELGLNSEYEQFIFGRPITEILNSHGLTLQRKRRSLQ